MLMNPAAPHRDRRFSTSGLMSARRGSLVLVALVASVSAIQPAAAQTAKDVLTKAEKVYSNAKSYQGSLVVKRSGKGQDGKPFTVTQTQTIKYKSPNLVRVQVAVTGTGAAAKSAGQSNSTVVSDGKNFYVYSPAQKQYMKRPAPPTFPLRQLLATVVPGANTPNAKLVAPAKVGGRAAYVIEIKPQAPPNMNAEQKKQFAKLKPIRVMIDKQNYQILKIHQSAPDAALDIAFTGQSLNPTIAASNFSWTPPAGAKEFVPPANPPAQGGAVPPPNPGG